jgi:hypothetical protein
MTNYGQAIGSVIGATIVVGAVGKMGRKGIKLTMNKTRKKKK